MPANKKCPTAATCLLALAALLLGPGCRSPEPVPPAPAAAADDSFAALCAYEFGQSRAPLFAIEKEIRAADPERAAAIEERLLDLLAAPEATFAAKQFACRQLRQIGSDRSVSALAALLHDEALGGEARFALEAHPSPEVDGILRRALRESSGAAQIGLAGSIGRRKDREAVPDLAQMAAGASPGAAKAAVEALGRIGGEKAAQALAALSVPAELQPSWLDARLACAESLLAEGDEPEAAALFTALSASTMPATVRVAAFRGLAAAANETAAAVILAMLRDPDETVVEAAGRFMTDLLASEAAVAVAGEMAGLAPAAQVIVLNSLAARAEPEAAECVAAAAAGEDETVRTAALAALGSLGGAEHVAILAAAAAAGGPAGEAAAEGLARIHGIGVDDRIRAAMRTETGAVRAALIACAVPRDLRGIVPDLIEFVWCGDAAVRGASLAALAELATQDDLAGLVALAGSAPDDETRRALEDAIVKTLRRAPAPDQQAALLLPYLTGSDPAVRASIVKVLAQIPSAAALEALSGAARDESPEVRLAVLAGLAGWQDAGPLDVLLEVASGAAAPEERAVALEGAIRLAGLPADRPAAEIEHTYGRLLKLATGPREQGLLIECLSKLDEAWALGALETLAASGTHRDAAAAACEKVLAAVIKKTPHEAQGCPVELTNPFGEKYSGGGKDALTDGKWGSLAFGDGCWQGFQGADLIATIDLGRDIEVRDVRANFLQDNNSWVFYPVSVAISLSRDGREFETVMASDLDVPGEMQPAATRFAAVWQGDPRPARYVRVHARNIGSLPAWHPGNGGAAWLMADEIAVNARMQK